MTEADLRGIENRLRWCDGLLCQLSAPPGAGDRPLARLHSAVVGGLIQLSWIRTELGIGDEADALAEHIGGQVAERR